MSCKYTDLVSSLLVAMPDASTMHKKTHAISHLEVPSLCSSCVEPHETTGTVILPFVLGIDMEYCCHVTIGAERVKRAVTADAMKGILPAEDVRVVLLEPSDACQPSQRPAVLVPVQNTKICEPQGELPVGVGSMCEHHTVSCTAQTQLCIEDHSCAKQTPARSRDNIGPPFQPRLLTCYSKHTLDKHVYKHLG